jgi:hypothetical protein
MNDNPGGYMAGAPMHRLQVIVVAICIALNALDGFDLIMGVGGIIAATMIILLPSDKPRPVPVA